MKNFIFLIFISGAFIGARSDHWSYPKEEKNGVVIENENWGGKCDTGNQQSPVDLAVDASVKGYYSSFLFSSGYSESLKNAAVINTGHSVQINNDVPSAITVTGGGLLGNYLFDQLHFHWGSEHTINSMRYGLELHLVHHEQKYASLTEAASHRKGVAVLGILFHVSGRSNPVLDSIIESGLIVKNDVGRSEILRKTFALSELLPLNRTTYFRYEGSLTTPGCGEAVIWTVFTHSLPISFEQIEKFKQIIQVDANETLTHNYRTLQPLNSRTLVYVSNQYEADSSATILSVSVSCAILLQMMHVLRQFIF